MGVKPNLLAVLAFSIALSVQAAAPLIWRGPVSGGVTDTSAVVKAKLAVRHGTARVHVSPRPDLSKPIIFGPVTATLERGWMVEFTATNLVPSTQYFYVLEVNGSLVPGSRGAFRTFPPANQPASFAFAFGSCARTGSEGPVFDTIRELRPLFFLHAGDFHYLDIKSNALVQFRMAYDRVLYSQRQSLLYRSLPLVYVWDDHDYAGNNSNRDATSQFAARTIYEEYIPHYDMPAGRSNAPIYQSFTVGRVKFIITDLRSERDSVRKPDGPGKTMLGAKQKAWFKEELLAAKGKYPLIVWVSTVPWIGEAGVNYYPIHDRVVGYVHHSDTRLFKSDPATAEQNRRVENDDDFWGAFAHERREIADFIRDNTITGLCIIHGDAHMLAADDGRHSDYASGGGARVPVMCGGPLDQAASIKGGPYSHGVFRARNGEGCFGYVQVTDAGARIDVRYSGRNFLNEEKITLRFSVSAGLR
jgi:phosphodiesterase/alkaline phosphatase D-like protein